MQHYRKTSAYCRQVPDIVLTMLFQSLGRSGLQFCTSVECTRSVAQAAVCRCGCVVAVELLHSRPPQSSAVTRLHIIALHGTTWECCQLLRVLELEWQEAVLEMYGGDAEESVWSSPASRWRTAYSGSTDRQTARVGDKSTMSGVGQRDMTPSCNCNWQRQTAHQQRSVHFTNAIGR